MGTITKKVSQFQSTFTGQEDNATSGINPGYVNAATYDFHLNAGSLALTAGQVVHSIGGNNGIVIPVGAYITGNEIIGRLSQSTDISAPMPPSNLAIQ